MRTIAFALGLLGLVVFPLELRAMVSPRAVAVLYNSAIPESRELAEFYADARGIPVENLVGLKMPASPDISRDEYEKSIAGPLRDEFDRRAWWRRGKDRAGIILPGINRIRVLVTVRGVPLRITATPKSAPAPAAASKPAGAAPAPPVNPMAGHDEASVDSELAMFGVEKLELEGALPNKYYQSTKPIEEAGMPFLVLTARIDAASYGTCERMVRDAVETEKTGLWGMAYVDIANKFPQGDQWLDGVTRETTSLGIPTVVDRFNETFPKNYPMSEAAVYFGWYDWHVSGPFLNPRFQFRKGAVAVHLHSFSAQQIGNATQNWCGPLLEKGAAVTVGNVFEPYLHLTHDLALLQKNLLAGDSWVEACWKAMPVTSWQGVVLGDPLYRPFKYLDGRGELKKRDNDYRALQAAFRQWPKNPLERRKKLGEAATRTRSGVFAEAVGLDLVQQGLSGEAMAYFRQAKELYTAPEDQMRAEMHLIAIDRSENRKGLAVKGLRDAQNRYLGTPGAEALKAWLDILDPPPPPPVKPPDAQGNPEATKKS